MAIQLQVWAHLHWLSFAAKTRLKVAMTVLTLATLGENSNVYRDIGYILLMWTKHDIIQGSDELGQNITLGQANNTGVLPDQRVNKAEQLYYLFTNIEPWLHLCHVTQGSQGKYSLCCYHACFFNKLYQCKYCLSVFVTLIYFHPSLMLGSGLD